MKSFIAALLFFIPVTVLGGLTVPDKAIIGARNLLTNPGFEFGATKWTASGGATKAVNTTAAGTGNSGYDWNSNGAAQTLISTSETIPAGMYGKNGVASCAIKTVSGTATHTMVVDDGSTALATAVTIQSNTTLFARTTVNFTFPASSGVRIKFASVNADEPEIYLDDCFLGLAEDYNLSPINALTTGWIAWTPTGSWSTNTPTYTGNYRRVGDSAEIEFKVALTGAVNNASLTINMPTGLVMDTTKMTRTSVNFGRLGISSGKSAGSGTNGFIAYNSTTSVVLVYQSSTAAAESLYSNTAPATWANGDEVNGVFTVPIVGWAGDTGFRPDQVPMSWSGKFSSGCNWARTSATQGNFTDSGGCSLTEVNNRNAGTVTAAGSTSPAVTLTMPRPGRYLVIADGSISGSAATTTENIYLTDGTTTFASCGAQTSATTQFSRCPLVGVYNYTGGSVTFTVQGNANGANTVTLGNIGPNALEFKIFQLDAAMPTPLLVGAITTSSSGVEHIERVSIPTKCTSSPCTIASNTPGISSVTRGGTGSYSVVFVAGTFSAAPTCTVGSYNLGTANGNCELEGAGTSSSQPTGCRVDTTGSLQDDAFNVICMGPK